MEMEFEVHILSTGSRAIGTWRGKCTLAYSYWVTKIVNVSLNSQCRENFMKIIIK